MAKFPPVADNSGAGGSAKHFISQTPTTTTTTAAAVAAAAPNPTRPFFASFAPSIQLSRFLVCLIVAPLGAPCCGAGGGAGQRLESTGRHISRPAPPTTMIRPPTSAAGLKSAPREPPASRLMMAGAGARERLAGRGAEPKQNNGRPIWLPPALAVPTMGPHKPQPGLRGRTDRPAGPQGSGKELGPSFESLVAPPARPEELTTGSGSVIRPRAQGPGQTDRAQGRPTAPWARSGATGVGPKSERAEALAPSSGACQGSRPQLTNEPVGARPPGAQSQ